MSMHSRSPWLLVPCFTTMDPLFRAVPREPTTPRALQHSSTSQRIRSCQRPGVSNLAVLAAATRSPKRSVQAAARLAACALRNIGMATGTTTRARKHTHTQIRSMIRIPSQASPSKRAVLHAVRRRSLSRSPASLWEPLHARTRVRAPLATTCSTRTLRL